MAPASGSTSDHSPEAMQDKAKKMSDLLSKISEELQKLKDKAEKLPQAEPSRNVPSSTASPKSVTAEVTSLRRYVTEEIFPELAERKLELDSSLWYYESEKMNDEEILKRINGYVADLDRFKAVAGDLGQMCENLEALQQQK